tara:strand:- start:56 stop:886 length:831 start_codon:yes stop_codon:yes gene_type:complete
MTSGQLPNNRHSESLHMLRLITPRSAADVTVYEMGPVRVSRMDPATRAMRLPFKCYRKVTFTRYGESRPRSLRLGDRKHAVDWAAESEPVSEEDESVEAADASIGVQDTLQDALRQDTPQGPPQSPLRRLPPPGNDEDICNLLPATALPGPPPMSFHERMDHQKTREMELLHLRYQAARQGIEAKYAAISMGLETAVVDPLASDWPAHPPVPSSAGATPSPVSPSFSPATSSALCPTPSPPCAPEGEVPARQKRCVTPRTSSRTATTKRRGRPKSR